MPAGIGAVPAGIGAGLTVADLVLPALLGAGITDLCAKTQHVRAVSGTARQVCAAGDANVCAVHIQCDALRHRRYIIFEQAGRSAVVASGRAAVTGHNAALYIVALLPLIRICIHRIFTPVLGILRRRKRGARPLFSVSQRPVLQRGVERSLQHQ